MMANTDKILLIAITLLLGTAAAGLEKKDVNAMDMVPKSCAIERVMKLLGYGCSKMNLNEVPSQLIKSGVEILDLSVNRIRELSSKSFANYPNIKYLYLFENVLVTIKPNTFSNLQELEALDLSTNGLTTIPKELFDLPLLRNLYISDNALHFLGDELTRIGKPIKAPLQRLGLSNCGLQDIPNFGPLPDLLFLNVSRNELKTVQPQDFSALCIVTEVDVNKSEIPMCKCHQVKQYLIGRSVSILGDLNCDAHLPERPEPTFYCPVQQNETSESPTFQTCSALVKIKQIKEETQMTWLTIVGCLFGFFIVFMSVLYLLHLRSVQQTKRAKMLAATKPKTSNPDESLLVQEERV